MIKFILFISAFFYFTGIYDYTVKDVEGHDISLSAFRGKKMLIVNTATGSKYASQFRSLDSLALFYKGSLVIIACPSNSFGNENTSTDKMGALLNKGHAVHFLVTQKINLSGAGASDLFDWLTIASKNGVLNCNLKGDFYKFLIDSSGNLIGVFAPEVDPLSEEMLSAIAN